MPKFYVQSGELDVVTTAANSRCAAIWAVHRTMSPTLPFLSDEAATDIHAGGTARLAETVCVSEQGFDRVDAERFDTLDVLTEWNRLLVAIDKLQERLGECHA
jgi:hypothetical protein